MGLFKSSNNENKTNVQWQIDALKSLLDKARFEKYIISNVRCEIKIIQNNNGWNDYGNDRHLYQKRMQELAPIFNRFVRFVVQII